MPTRCQKILDQPRLIPSVVGVERLLDRKIESDVGTIVVTFFPRNHTRRKVALAGGDCVRQALKIAFACERAKKGST